MKITTQIKKERMRQDIFECAVDLVNQITIGTNEQDYQNAYDLFSKRLKVILNI